HFPENTVHLVALKFLADKSTEKGHGADNTRYLLTRYRGQFIVTPDTGLFTLIDPAFAEPVYQLYYEEGDSHHFFLRDIFVPVTLQLLRDPEPGQVGVPVTDYYRAQPFESYLDRNVLRGKGIYVDDFGNIVTNITREKFAEAVGDRNFVITL